jgi:hypothetical protein
MSRKTAIQWLTFGIYFAIHFLGSSIGFINFLGLVFCLSTLWILWLAFINASRPMSDKIRTFGVNLIFSFAGLTLAPLIQLIIYARSDATIIEHLKAIIEIFIMFFVLQTLPSWLCVILGFSLGFLILLIISWLVVRRN